MSQHFCSREHIMQLENFPSTMTTSEKIRCLCALFHSCKQCSLDQTAGSGFTIVSQSPFLFERINIWLHLLARI